ncbi:hypothetical protein FOL47_003877 [Perkinsus chesapeaki]|uniref:Uncharacterized protein n=1 Tax=Perkinsus chesapeaki TaxID=330153 RepID=A0A7J6M5L3_PERCH|nr:hypothetical protein FOL47_003877 [Perkinsus chesapeaki]
MGHSGSIQSPSYSPPTPFGNQTLSDPFAARYGEGDPYAVDLTRTPGSRVGQSARGYGVTITRSSSSSRSLHRGSSDSLLGVRPTVNPDKGKARSPIVVASASPAMSDHSRGRRYSAPIADNISETFSDFLNSSREQSSEEEQPSPHSVSQSEQSVPLGPYTTEELDEKEPTVSSKPPPAIAGIRIMAFEELELPSEEEFDDDRSEGNRQHIDSIDVDDDDRPTSPPIEEEVDSKGIVSVEDLVEGKTDFTESISAISPAHRSYADDAFEDESSMGTDVDDVRPKDDSSDTVQISQTFLEGNARYGIVTITRTVPTPRSLRTPRSARRRRHSGSTPRVRHSLECGIQVDGLPQSIGTQYDPPELGISDQTASPPQPQQQQPPVVYYTHRPAPMLPDKPYALESPLEMVNELLDEAFKEQLSLLRAAASQQRAALESFLPFKNRP